MRTALRYQVVGPLNSSPGSRALLGLRFEDSDVTPVVILPVPRKTLDDPEALLRLRKETDRAVGLQHPSILRVLGLIPFKRGLARTTAYANGESLRRIFSRAGRLPPELAGRIVTDAAMGVHYAHLAANEEGTPLVHGDLRPETLMVTYAGVTVVTGYGALTVAPTEMGGKRVPGRRKYSAPEQLLGGRSAATTQTDVFLLGLVLWEALTGSVPFQDAAQPDQATISDGLSPDAPRIPEKLRPVLERALAKKGTDRYPTALAFREAVEEAMGPLATAGECSDWLAKKFVGDPQTMAERALVERALSDAARGVLPETPAIEPFPAVRIPPPPPVPPRAKPRAPAPATVAATQPARAAGSRIPGYMLGIAVVLALAAGAAGGWFARGVLQAPPERIVADEVLPPQPAAPKLTIVTPTPAPEATADAAVEAEAAPTPVQPPPEPAVTPPPDKNRTTRKTPAAAEPATVADETVPTLELFSVPEVEARLGTRSLGHTPLKAQVLPGKQTLKLVNPGLGINVTREVDVKPTGSTQVQVTIGVGSVGVHAPKGAKVYLDHKPVGLAPGARRQLYEGTHQVRVELDAQQWEEEEFEITDGARLTFTARADLRVRTAGSGPPAPLKLTKDAAADVRPEIP